MQAFINDGLYPFAAGIEDDLTPVLEEEGVTLLDLAAQGSAIFAQATVTGKRGLRAHSTESKHKFIAT